MFKVWQGRGEEATQEHTWEFRRAGQDRAQQDKATQGKQERNKRRNRGQSYVIRTFKKKHGFVYKDNEEVYKDTQENVV